jgi:hypothetical protein
LWQGPLASGPQRLVAVCPGQHAPTRVRRHCGGLVTARHLAPALLTAHRLCSTRSPCSSRLHVRAMPLSRVAATQKPCSPPLPRQPPSSRPSLLSSLFASATTAHIADRTNHCCCRRPRAPKPCHHIVLLSAREAVGLRPSSGQATNSPSSAWVPPSSPTGEPTARPQYQPTADVLPCSDYRRRGKRYSGEPPLPDAPQTSSPTVGLPIATGPLT